MAMQDERIFFMEDYAGNPVAEPESNAQAFQKEQEELKCRVAAGENVESPLDPELKAWLEEWGRSLKAKKSSTSGDTSDS